MVLRYVGESLIQPSLCSHITVIPEIMLREANDCFSFVLLSKYIRLKFEKLPVIVYRLTILSETSIPQAVGSLTIESCDVSEPWYWVSE